MADQPATRNGYKDYVLNCGCGSVGRAVASDARGLWFESSHRQTFILDIYLLTVHCIEKTKRKRKKRPEMAHFIIKKKDYQLSTSFENVLSMICDFFFELDRVPRFLPVDVLKSSLALWLVLGSLNGKQST